MKSIYVYIVLIVNLLAFVRGGGLDARHIQFYDTENLSAEIHLITDNACLVSPDTSEKVFSDNIFSRDELSMGRIMCSHGIRAFISSSSNISSDSFVNEMMLRNNESQLNISASYYQLYNIESFFSNLII